MHSQRSRSRHLTTRRGIVRKFFLLTVCLAIAAVYSRAPAAEVLLVATFQVDATPPVGAPLCDGLVEPAREVIDPLSARGIVLLGAGQPIVLCAVDWVGIGNDGYTAWRSALASAAGTVVDRVAVHCLHQHDAPGCDFAAEELLAAHGIAGQGFHTLHARQTINAAANAVRQALSNGMPVTHLGIGRARVEQVASNRRILGPDGKVAVVRYSSSKIPEAIAAPEGTIDPDVQILSFWNDDRPIVALSYYATHPQSYYGQGGVSADFVGMARNLRERELPGVVHVHFNGAGGNVAAGKYNDGSPENRPVLAGRLAAGMQTAWNSTVKSPISASDIFWRTVDVKLPLAPHLDREQLLALLADSNQRVGERIRASRDLAWLDRADRGESIQLSALSMGQAVAVHMPGELFVEYQLMARQMRPDLAVCMAAYGDYGPGYIGTEAAYGQGGYETGYVSRVSPKAEIELRAGLKTLLAEPDSPP